MRAAEPGEWAEQCSLWAAVVCVVLQETARDGGPTVERTRERELGALLVVGAHCLVSVLLIAILTVNHSHSTFCRCMAPFILLLQLDAAVATDDGSIHTPSLPLHVITKPHPLPLPHTPCVGMETLDL